MKFTFNVDDVMGALQFVCPIINKKNSMPILDDVLFDVSADTNSVKLKASDTENEMSVVADIIEADESAKICLNAALLMRILSKLSGKVLTIETNASTHEAKGVYDGGVFNMVYDDADSFPSIYTDNEYLFNAIVQRPIDIVNGLKDTLFATGTDELRPILMGVYFDFTEDGLVFVGTNGQILSKHKNDEIKIHDGRGFVLQKKPSSALRTFLQQYHEELVYVRCSERFVIIENERFSLISRLMEQKFPNYNSVIPQQFAQNFTINRESLIGALARTAVFASSSELVVFDINKEYVEVQCQDLDYSMSGKERVPYLSCEIDKHVRIGFKASLMASILRNIESDGVRFFVNDPSHAVIATPSEETSTKSIHLIMPMHFAS